MHQRFKNKILEGSNSGMSAAIIAYREAARFLGGPTMPCSESGVLNLVRTAKGT